VRNGRPIRSDGEAVVYWMQRAQRASDNPALDAAISLANELGKPLAVFMGLVPFYPNANARHYAFLIDGLLELGPAIEKRGAAFIFRPYPAHDLRAFCREVGAAAVVGDENPLREPERWREETARRLDVPVVTVDADVVVPTSHFPKEEYAARTLRPKIQALVEKYLVPVREPRVRVPFPSRKRPASTPIDKAKLLRELPLDRSAAPVEEARGGAREAERTLAAFLEAGLGGYAEARNRPENATGTSRLSAFLHFGQIGPRHVARSVREADAPARAKAVFLEELIVRRELAVNFVLRNPFYDTLDGLHPWARKTLREHASDPRPHRCDAATLERAATHDPLWNAAQREMVLTGRMHGYMRMYWAKKILEWSADPAEAMATAILFNDRYELDGRDPNGYTGIAWAIGGKHDRAWGPRRPIFGLIRYMSFASTSRKFASRDYIERVAALDRRASGEIESPGIARRRAR